MPNLSPPDGGQVMTATALSKWQDADGGWHTGTKILTPDGFSVSWGGPDHGTWFLVRESCDGRLTWVRAVDLERWAPRGEWEKPGE
jgi:hypothetical protein